MLTNAKPPGYTMPVRFLPRLYLKKLQETAGTPFVYLPKPIVRAFGWKRGAMLQIGMTESTIVISLAPEFTHGT